MYSATAPSERLHQLFLLNLSLQLFDGVATYQGFHIWGEGNPLIGSAISQLGMLIGLVLYKAKACGLLVLLRRLGGYRIAYDSLVVLATVYTCLSFLPWMSRLLSLLVV